MLRRCRCVVVFGCKYMPCFHPVESYQKANRSVVFGKLAGPGFDRGLRLPCGQCIGCRLRRSAMWAVRCVHEMRMHDYSSYVTLTYNDEHVPHDGSLCYRDFQLFMKRFRKVYPHVRYYMCGEYGDENGRPHFHAIIFGHFFRDRCYWMQSPSGSALYTSAELSRFWPFGFVTVGDVSFESAAYVARYVMKKVTGDAAFEHYKRVTPDGEVLWLRPEFTRMSLKPGIGATWFEKYGKQVYPRDEVIVGGRKMPPPRYYDQLLERVCPERLDWVKADREIRGMKYIDDNTFERLADREKVAAAGMSFKLRGKV